MCVCVCVCERELRKRWDLTISEVKTLSKTPQVITLEFNLAYFKTKSFTHCKVIEEELLVLTSTQLRKKEKKTV